MQRENSLAAAARLTCRLIPAAHASGAPAAMGTARLSSAAKLSASTLVATSTNKAC